MDVSAHEGAHLVTDARAARAHASIGRRGPGVIQSLPAPWRPLEPPGTHPPQVRTGRVSGPWRAELFGL